jgi:hypothetical protein
MWPARSPDLSSCESQQWGALKQKMQHKNPDTLAELEAKVPAEAAANQEKGLSFVETNYL